MVKFAFLHLLTLSAFALVHTDIHARDGIREESGGSSHRIVGGGIIDIGPSEEIITNLKNERPKMFLGRVLRRIL